MKYRFIRKCIISCFRCLVKLGLRQRIFRAAAFFPPKLPTYVLKPINIRESNSLSKQRLRTSQHPQPGTPKYSSLFQSEDSFRFHRISSVITEKPLQKNSTPSSQQIEEESKNKEIEGEKILIQRQSKQQSKIFYKTRLKSKLHRYEEYEVKLISRRLSAPVSITIPDELSVTGLYLRTSGSKYFACFNIEMVESDYVLIYSHGNSPDLGIMLDTYLDLSFNLGINVFAYDYLGYGQSFGAPDDLDMIEQIKIVYKFVRYTLNFEWNKIILYGHSLGTGVSTVLAANQDCPVAGLVIHSGFMSGLRIVDPTLGFEKFDLFPNLELLEYVNCLVFVIHGQKDEQIGPDHGTAMARKCRNLYRIWYAEEGGHNDIAYNEKTRIDYFRNLREFYLQIKEKNQSLTIEEILKINRAGQWKQNLGHFYNQPVSRHDQAILKQITLNDTLLSKRGTSQIEMNPSSRTFSSNSPLMKLRNNSRAQSSQDYQQKSSEVKPAVNSS